MLKLVFDKESCSKQNFFVLRCFRSGESLDFSNKSFITLTKGIETFREYVLTKNSKQSSIQFSTRHLIVLHLLKNPKQTNSNDFHTRNCCKDCCCCCCYASFSNNNYLICVIQQRTQGACQSALELACTWRKQEVIFTSPIRCSLVRG